MTVKIKEKLLPGFDVEPGADNFEWVVYMKVTDFVVLKQIFSCSLS